jgi:hypothetical protein
MILSYADLKDKIKVGDKVRAAIGKDNACTELGRCGLTKDNSRVATITEVRDSSFRINGCLHWFEKTDLFLDLMNTQPKTLETLEVGDKLTRMGDEATILAVLGEGPKRVYMTSLFSNAESYGTWATVQDLKLRGFTLPTPTPTRTVDDVLASLPQADKDIIQSALKSQL